MAENLVTAPVFIFTLLLTITDVTGKPPANPETRLPNPCAHNSRLNGFYGHVHPICPRLQY